MQGASDDGDHRVSAWLRAPSVIGCALHELTRRAMDRQKSLISDISRYSAERFEEHLRDAPLLEVLSAGAVERVALAVVKALLVALMGAWKGVIEEFAVQMVRECPRCGESRKCRYRRDDPMKLAGLGFELDVGKPYVCCGNPACDAPGVSIVRLLTGLGSGASTPMLRLLAAHSAADRSYGETQKELATHPLGEEIERTKVRRLALQVEEDALKFAEVRRLESERALLRQTAPAQVVPLLELQADGGTVRTGHLRPIGEGEEGFGELTPKRGVPKQRRETHWREVITMDVRGPEETEARAQDVVVSVLAPDGEKSRRMLTAAERAGFSDETEMYGLGDLGSGLANAFDEAFVGSKFYWQADWKHTWDYIKNAAGVFRDEVDTETWMSAIRTAVRAHDEQKRDDLMDMAWDYREPTRAARKDKCPVHALETYLTNNWSRMKFDDMEALGRPIVSARAEAQVRDRIKRRFSGPGTWLLENIEGKAILRAMIADGSYGEFVTWFLDHHAYGEFQRALHERLKEAVAQHRMRRRTVELLCNPNATIATILEQLVLDAGEQEALAA